MSHSRAKAEHRANLIMLFVIGMLMAGTGIMSLVMIHTQPILP